MSGKFRYLIYGVSLILLIIIGTLSFTLSNAQVDEIVAQELIIQTHDHNQVELLPVQVIEASPIPTPLRSQEGQIAIEAPIRESLPPLIFKEDIISQEDIGEAVLVKVASLNGQRMKSLLANGEGWLFIQSDHYAPNSSNSPLPNGAAWPVSHQIESWAYLYADGLADKSYDRMLDSNGFPVQESFFKDGWFYDNTHEQVFQAETNVLNLNPDQDSYGFLSRDFEGGGQLLGWSEEREGRVIYIASSTSHFENPVEFGASPLKVVSIRYNFTYDMATGAFLYGETIFILEGGEEILWESVTQTKFEIISQSDLPNNLVTFLAGK